MKRGVNKVILLGVLGQDPESRFTGSGDQVTNISLATSESWKDKNTGEQKEVTEWHRCVAYKKAAELISQYCKKGSKIYLEGRLQTRSWDRDGQKHYTTEIIIEEFQFVGDPQKKEQSQGDRREAPERPDHKQGMQGVKEVLNDFDDDLIPF